MKKKMGGGSDSTAYNKKKIDGSLKIMKARDTTTPVGKQAFNSLTKGMEALAKAENKKAGVPEPKKALPKSGSYTPGKGLNTKKK